MQAVPHEEVINKSDGRKVGRKLHISCTGHTEQIPRGE